MIAKIRADKRENNEGGMKFTLRGISLINQLFVLAYNDNRYHIMFQFDQSFYQWL